MLASLAVVARGVWRVTWLLEGWHAVCVQPPVGCDGMGPMSIADTPQTAALLVGP